MVKIDYEPFCDNFEEWLRDHARRMERSYNNKLPHDRRPMDYAKIVESNEILLMYLKMQNEFLRKWRDRLSRD